MDATQPHILVVDDLADSADSLAELLTLWGYDAEPLYSGSTALEAARTRPPDAVLLDLGMPRMTGLQFALRFRDVPGCEGTPIVAVTGHHALRLQAREMGIDHFLLKPVDLGFLRELLRRLTATTEPLRLPEETPVPANGTVPRWLRHGVTRVRSAVLERFTLTNG